MNEIWDLPFLFFILSVVQQTTKNYNHKKEFWRFEILEIAIAHAFLEKLYLINCEEVNRGCSTIKHNWEDLAHRVEKILNWKYWGGSGGFLKKSNCGVKIIRLVVKLRTKIIPTHSHENFKPGNKLK